MYVFARKIKYHASYHKMRRLLYYKMLQPFFSKCASYYKTRRKYTLPQNNKLKKRSTSFPQDKLYFNNWCTKIDNEWTIKSLCVIFNPTIALDLSSPKTCKVRKWKRISVVNKSYFIVLGYKAVVCSESDILTFHSSRQNLTMSKQLSTFGYLLNCEITYRGNRIN